MGLAHLARGTMCFNTFKWQTDTWRRVYVLKSDYISASAGVFGVGYVSVGVEAPYTHYPSDSQKAENRAEGQGFAAKAAGIHEAIQWTLCSRLLLCGYIFLR